MSARTVDVGDGHCEACPFSACLVCGYKGGTWGTEGRPE